MSSLLLNLIIIIDNNKIKTDGLQSLFSLFIMRIKNDI
ncbi:hypothetical protein BAC_3368 [Bacillus anthracis str. A0488]|nr:hypothetical protein BAMEG_1276 [Bacillus anthracis str. CDC 684]ACQ49105.1 hypothetical protein BAA_3384 [Bacillus anthracis str. A0248]AFH84574.1 Hypothetical Protein H9401_3188 [Bacillus anthracis str. H9401]AHK39347.1 hypothetical protein BAPAT_3205 [Bacillus anthracis str. SVA11]EDR21253.1 hypothetical protein BAC_3368 [Bacillus anthracis str. A0488]EDR89992.1 hypothetical protein BAQ_3388 [Bacillus anthracis str. A0193]EDR95505.1 hypothetical protein BAH_3413 [Bacillus anthracis str.